MSLVPTGCYMVKQDEMIYEEALLKNSINVGMLFQKGFIPLCKILHAYIVAQTW